MIAVVTVLLSLVFAGSSDLMELIEAANQAEVTGRQLSITYAEEGITSDLRQVALDGGMAMAVSSGGATLAGGGVLYKDDETAAAMPISLPMGLGSKYGVEVTDTGGDVSVLVSEGETKRAWFSFDAETGAANVREVYDADGHVFRLQVFMPAAYEHSMPASEDMPEPDMMEQSSSDSLPDLLGYQSGGEFKTDGGGAHGYYSDGLFRISVFAFPAGSAINGMANAYEVEYGGRDDYRRSYGPSTTTISWQAADSTYVVVGDAPPDHMASAVSQLPPPASQNWFARTWRKLFG